MTPLFWDSKEMPDSGDREREKQDKNIPSHSVINEVNVKHSVSTNVQSVKHFPKPINIVTIVWPDPWSLG